MDTPHTPETGLAEALKNTTASAIARELKITPSAVLQWERVPAERVRAVASFTGVPPEVIRPDIFGPAPKQETAA